MKTEIIDSFTYEKAVVEKAQNWQSKRWLPVLFRSLNIITMDKLSDPFMLPF